MQICDLYPPHFFSFMYPISRLLISSVRALAAEKISIDDTCETVFYCRPWDIDMFLEMNNGRVLTLYDLGRFDFAIRTGFAKTLKENKWGLVVAGSSIRYRNRIKMFDRVSIYTQVVYFDERWIYIVQSMWVKQKPASSVLLRTGRNRKGESDFYRENH